MESIDRMVLVGGVSCVAYFVVWMIGRRSESLGAAFDSLPAALVAFGALCAAPLFAYNAWQEFGAQARLEAEQFPPCDALGHAVGAQGGRAPRGIWRFQALDDPDPILAFYRERLAADGWRIERRQNGFLANRAGVRFAVWNEKHGDQNQLVFQRNP